MHGVGRKASARPVFLDTALACGTEIFYEGMTCSTITPCVPLNAALIRRALCIRPQGVCNARKMINFAL
jgi:hypothetical protein